MTLQRVDAPYTGDERTMLNGWLDYHRATLELKCAGLTDDQLRERSAPPSALSLLGLVRHMAEVERIWFRIRLAGEPIGYIWITDDDGDADFDGVDTADVREAFDAYHAEIDAARAIVASHDTLDATFEHPRRGHISLRWVLVHMIEEYARHNGHADLIRERIDGTIGD